MSNNAIETETMEHRLLPAVRATLRYSDQCPKKYQIRAMTPDRAIQMLRKL